MTPSLLGRALVAVALMVGFYALALALAGFLLWIPYAEIVYSERIHIKLAIACLVGAGTILWSIIPRVERFVPPGPELALHEQPELFRELEGVARLTGQQMPAEVYLIPEVNAWVAQRGGVMGFGSHRVMGLGLPLLQTITVSQARAVLAHEFGHYHGGDTSIGPWIYKTRDAIGRTARNLAQAKSLFSLPFIWYGNMFLRLTLAISRQQEYSADQLAARTVGAQSLIEGLKQIHRTAAAAAPFWQSEVEPVVSRGFRAPLAGGFQQFLSSPEIASQVEKQLEQQLQTSESDPYDSHPPLKDRIAALADAPAGDGLPDPRAAIELICNLDAQEQSLLQMLFGPEQALTPIGWDEVGQTVLVPTWQERVRANRQSLKGVMPSSFPELAEAHRRAVADLENATERSVQQEEEEGRRSAEDEAPVNLGIQAAGDVQSALSRLERAATASAALGLALHSQGWTLHALPGELYLEKNGETIRPFMVIENLKSGALTAQAWREQCERVGIADADLANVS